MRRLLPDAFILTLIGVLLLATFVPAAGRAADAVGIVATSAVVMLFFLHGLRLPRDGLIAALVHWRLHLAILATTFIAVPLFSLALSAALPSLLPAGLWAGVLFLATLPSTVQMSIALTSMAGGNVGAAVTAAAVSNLLGVVATPLVAGILLSASGGEVPVSGIWKIIVQLLLPFAAGHLLRPWLGAWAQRQKSLLSWADRATVLIAVYAAFSAAVIQGIWRQFSPITVVLLVAVCALLLAMVLLWTRLAARWFGFAPGDARALRYAGATKSLVSGVPMARVLFPSAEIGLVMLPIMIYHQLQLMVGAALARRQGSAQR